MYAIFSITSGYDAAISSNNLNHQEPLSYDDQPKESREFIHPMCDHVEIQAEPTAEIAQVAEVALRLNNNNNRRKRYIHTFRPLFVYRLLAEEERKSEQHRFPIEPLPSKYISNYYSE